MNNGMESLSLVLWLDILERLDTLLLEIRHQQVNIIHSLHCEELYKALRYEEDYLWGCYKSCSNCPSSKDCNDNKFQYKYWQDLFYDARLSQDNIIGLAHKWIIDFPLPQYTNNDSNKDDDLNLHFSYANTCRKEILEEIKQSAFEKWDGGAWDQETKRMYVCLISLQLIKRRILEDKLWLCFYGTRAFDLKKDMPRGDKNKIADFIIVRSVLMKRADTYVVDIGDINAQYGRYIDIALQDNPKPMVGRRREQGIYLTFLANICGITIREMELLLKHVNSSKEIKQIGIYLHRCSQYPVSENRVSTDWTSYSNVDDVSVDINMFNTSYWMPDRPDLQQLIAHEVGHTIIKHKYDNLLKERLAEDINDPLSRFCWNMYVLMSGSGLNMDITNSEPRHDPRYSLREIVADILAVSVSGPAYLFAIFQELVGNGLYSILDTPEGYPDPAQGNIVFNSGIGGNGDIIEVEWYYRLEMACTCLEERQSDDHVMISFLIKGIREISDVLLKRCFELTPSAREKHKFWYKLVEGMKTILKHSEFMALIKEWAINRDKNSEELSYYHNQLKLHKDVQVFFIKMLLNYKTQPYRPLYNKDIDDILDNTNKITKKLSDIYFKKNDKLELFNYLYDIPWQSTILRALDYFITPNFNNLWLFTMHQDTAPGREIYQLALDFVFQQIDNPLRHLVNYSSSTNNYNNKTIESLYNEINKLTIDNNTESNIVRLLEDSYQNKEQQNYFISSLLCRISNGLLIDKLINILFKNLSDKCAGNNLIKSTLDLSPYNKSGKIKEFIGLFNNFYINGENKLKLPRYKMFMLNRIIFSYYDTNIEYNSWVYNKKMNILDESEQEYSQRYFVTLGRHDVLKIFPTLPMCRCLLPNFLLHKEKSPSSDTIRSFFVRREFTIPVRLSGNNLFDNNKEFDIGENVIALVSVFLARRSERLAFIYRLHRLINESDSCGEDNLKDIACLFAKTTEEKSSGDFAFLTEGWGDVILVFRDSSNSRLKNIFKIQNAIFDDCMVDRTETILTKKAMGQFNSEFFKLQINIKVKEFKHYNEELTHKDFLNEIHDKLRENNIEYSIIRTPGITDYTVIIDNVPENIDIYNLIPKKYIDKTQTIIGIKENLLDTHRSRMKSRRSLKKLPHTPKNFF